MISLYRNALIQKENFNVNIKQRGGSSDFDIVELKNYTQVENSPNEMKMEISINSVSNKPPNDIQENNLEQSSFDLKEFQSEEKEMPPLTNNASSKQSISSPNTSCSPQSDKLNNAEDKMNEDDGKVWEEGFTKLYTIIGVIVIRFVVTSTGWSTHISPSKTC